MAVLANIYNQGSWKAIYMPDRNVTIRLSTFGSFISSSSPSSAGTLFQSVFIHSSFICLENHRVN
jgi:hypothetical protein